MRTAIGLACLFALLGCAAPKPAALPAAPIAKTETEQQKAQRLINFAVESGEPINTADGQKLLCRQESVTNTRLKNRKICLTEQQWAERTDNARDAFRDATKAGDSLPSEQRR